MRLLLNFVIFVFSVALIFLDCVKAFRFTSRMQNGVPVSSRPNCVRTLRMNNQYDYDVIIVGCGVGGHAAALHARANGLKTAVLTGNDVGGTCVNRGCVPSKALLAASGRVRELKNEHHLKSFGITVQNVNFDRALIANHAAQLANRVKNNLEASLTAQGVDVIDSMGQVTDKVHEIQVTSLKKIITAKDIILAPGSVPFVPPGVQVDEVTVLTSDGALRLDNIPQVHYLIHLSIILDQTQNFNI